MTRINLLPPEIKEKAERPRLAPLFILMGVIVIVILVGLFLFYSSQKSSKEDAKQEKQQELQDLQKQTKPIEQFEAQQRELKSLEGLYQQANTGRVAWAQMLNELAMYVPEGLATASNPRAPAIWLVHVAIDAKPLEALAVAPEQQQAAAGAVPILIEGNATPAWLCIQTWLPRASDFKAKGFLDAYPYYYYFRGHPKVAEFYVRLQNMEEWSNLWIESSTQTTIAEDRALRNPVTDPETGAITYETQVEAFSDWAISFTISAMWNPETAIWGGTGQETATAGSSEQ